MISTGRREYHALPKYNIVKKGMSEKYEYWNVIINGCNVCSRYWINYLYCWFYVLLFSLENCKKNQKWHTIIRLIGTE